jgi:hypothetical protein
MNIECPMSNFEGAVLQNSLFGVRHSDFKFLGFGVPGCLVPRHTARAGPEFIHLHSGASRQPMHLLLRAPTMAQSLGERTC